MSKLLSANFMRLRKNKCFWGGILFMLIVGAGYPVMMYVQMKRTEFIFNLDSRFFSCAIYAAILLSVFCSLFVGTEYSDGTIRNKIIIGHKRTNIYFANLLTNMFVGLMMCAVFFVVYLFMGIPLLGFFETNIIVVLMYVGIVFVLSFAFSSLFTMIAMINSNKAIAAVICILGAFIMLIAEAFINSRLQEPEIYPAYSYVKGGVEVSEKEEKNPNYLVGTKRKIYQFLYDFLPGGQVIQCASRKAENPYMLPVYSAIVFMISTSTGIVIFRRKDIK